MRASPLCTKINLRNFEELIFQIVQHLKNIKIKSLERDHFLNLKILREILKEITGRHCYIKIL